MALIQLLSFISTQKFDSPDHILATTSSILGPKRSGELSTQPIISSSILSKNRKYIPRGISIYESVHTQIG